jgi:hypothetical protein
MSYTEIYKFKKDGNTEFLNETQNAYRGAMAVWNIMDKKYLPPYVPKHKIIIDIEYYYRSFEMGGKALGEVWGLFDNGAVSRVDRIVLGSTFDNAIVKKENLEELIKAFREFEGETSLKEQADIIEDAFKNDDDLIAIGWNQTSVNGDAWIEYYDENDEAVMYNILSMNKHFDVFEDLK